MSLILLLACLASGARAQEPKILRIDVIDYGIYAIKKPKPGGSVGLADIRHVKSTREIPAELGTRFGFRYNVVGTPKGSEVRFRKVITFPPPGLRNPASTETVRTTEDMLTRKVSAGVEFSGYSLDNAWELAPGKWTIELWDGKKKLASQKFTLVAPKKGP